MVSMSATEQFPVPPELAGQTLAALLRRHLSGHSWSQVRRLVATRRVQVNGELWLDDARRLKPGDTVTVLPQPRRPPPERDVVALAEGIRHLDEHLVVVEKPSGLNTVRHPAELDWAEERKALSPTVHDLLPEAIALRGGDDPRRRLRIVHRLDKETSGLVVFARSVPAERGLGKQFHDHTVTRRYLAVVPGAVAPQRIATRLVRDRGDGRRGSAREPGVGKGAVTHVEVAERLPGHTLLACRLETGRTHQIRIHLAELGHPVCGDPVYRGPPGVPVPDGSGAPRLALHAAELGFVHPATGAALHWTMDPPPDLRRFAERLRGGR